MEVCTMKDLILQFEISLMKKINFCAIILVLCINSIFGQVKVYETFDDLEISLLKDLSDDTTYVVNFWATWCGPCVKELPYFEELNAMYSDQSFRQILVSLDDPKKLSTKVIPFIENNNIESEVVLLADGKANNWIDRVDPRWSGAIPITLILRGDKKLFYEREFHNVEELEEVLLLLFKN